MNSSKLYCGTTWIWTKCLEKKVDGNCSKMLRIVLNKSWKQHPTKQQLATPTSHLKNHPNTVNKHVGHNLRSKDELGWPAKTYIYWLSADIGYHLEDLPWTTVKKIWAVSTLWLMMMMMMIDMSIFGSCNV